MPKQTIFNSLLAALALAMLTPNPAPAQTWELITPNVPGAVRGDQHSLDTDGTRLYVLGLPAGVFVSTDHGNSFSPVNDVADAAYTMTNLPGRFLKYVNGFIWVGFDPGSGAFNLGEASLHRLVPGQAVWQKCSNGFPLGDTGNQADDIAYDASTGTYCVGAALGGAFFSTDGLNWQQRTSGLGGLGLPTSVIAFNGLNFELRPLTQVCKTTNQGTNWTTLASHQGISSGYLLQLGGRVMFASSGNNTLQDGFNYSDDYGATWNFLTGIRGTADLVEKDGLIYAAGLCGGVVEEYYGRYGVKFSATQGLSWDNLPTNGLPIDPGGGINANRIVRQGNYLFMHASTNLYRLDVSGFDFTPTTQLLRQFPAVTNFLTGQTIKLSVLAAGANVTYHWQFQGTNIAGATDATFSLPLARTNDSGTYQVVIVGDRGSITSSPVALTVTDRVEGKYDVTYNNPATGGRIYLLPDSSLVSVGGATFYKMKPTGERAVTRTISGATLPANCLDSSNRVLLAGRFTQSPQGNRVIRVFANDLTDDPAFKLNFINNTIAAIVELPGRGYLVGGSFTSITNVGISTNQVKYLCLLNYSGVVDTNFLIGVGPNNLVSALAVTTGSDIYVQGSFSTWNGSNSFNFVKLNADGSLDPAFSHTATANAVSYFQPAASNKLFAVVSSRPVLLNSDGTPDAGFNSANAIFNNAVKSIAVGESNKLYVAGSFTTYAGKSLGKYVRLFSDGTVDTNFDTTVAPTSGGFAGDVYDPRGYLYLVRDTSSGTFMGQSFGTGPYRLFAGTNALAFPANPSFGEWTAQFTFPPGQADPEADADGDGIRNVFEYYFGSNPVNAASGAKPIAVTVNTGGLQYPAITFTRSQSVTGVTMLPQVSSNPQFTDSLGYTVESVVDLGDGTEQVTIRSNTSVMSKSAQFLRLQLALLD